MSFPKHQAFLSTLDVVEQAKQALRSASDDVTTATAEHRAAFDEAASGDKPSKATLARCNESILAERIAVRRFELAEKALADAEVVSTDAFHAACGEVLTHLAKWSADRRAKDLKRILGDSPVTAQQEQDAERIVENSVQMAQCRQLSLTLNPPPLTGGAGALQRAVTFLSENR